MYFVEDIEYQDPLGPSDHISLLLVLSLDKPEQVYNPRKLYYKGDYEAMNTY